MTEKADRLAMANKAVSTSKDKLATAETAIAEARAKYDAAIEAGDRDAAINAKASISAAETEADICRRVLQKAESHAAERLRESRRAELDSLERELIWDVQKAAYLKSIETLDKARQAAFNAVDKLEEQHAGIRAKGQRARELADLLGVRTRAEAVSYEVVHALALERLSQTPEPWRGPGHQLSDWLRVVREGDARMTELLKLFNAPSIVRTFTNWHSTGAAKACAVRLLLEHGPLDESDMRECADAEKGAA